MKNTILFLIILLFFSFINGQHENKNINNTGKKLAFKLGYSFPYKETFRKNYSYRFNAGLEGICIYSNSTDYFIEIECRYNKNNIFSDTDLYIIPAFFGIKYNLNQSTFDESDFKLYAGAAAGYYFIHFRKKNAILIGSDGSEEKIFTYSRNYHGYGLKILFVIEWYIGDETNIGLEFNFDITRVGSAKTGGLGNIGGLSLKALIAFPI